MLSLLLGTVAAARLVVSSRLLDRNLVYHSPFVGYPEFAHDTYSIHARHLENVRRQVADASKFEDDHYATFYGGDFGNSPFVWNGGINFTHSVASVSDTTTMYVI